MICSIFLSLSPSPFFSLLSPAPSFSPFEIENRRIFLLTPPNLLILISAKSWLTHLRRLWCWERLTAGAERDDRGWDGWMASLIRWTWIWVDSGSWWWTGSPGVLRFMGSQRVGHDWVTELNWDWNMFKTYTAKPSATSKTTDYRGKAKRPIERKNRRLKK